MRRALAALALAVVLPLPSLAQVVVKPGETLGEIAERYGVSVNRLMQANGIKDPTLVQIGQRLVIPGRGGAGASSGRASGGSVVVKSGETLGEIAERYGVSVDRLMQANGIKDPTLVQIGQRLVIPGRGGATRTGGGGGGSRATAGGRYTVQSGETLGEIAERFNTSVNRLMQLNGISDPTQLQAGSRIVVPGAAARPASRSTAQAPRGAKPKEHVVQPGESLSEIADAYNLPIQKLVSLNNLSDPNLLMSGTRLKLTAPPPVPASRPAPKPRKAATPKPKPAVAAKPKPKPAATTAAPAAPAVASTIQPTTKPAPAATPKPAATTAASAATTVAPVASQPRPTTATSSPAATTQAPATTAAAPATAAAKPATTTAAASTAAPASTTATPAATTARPQVAARPTLQPRPAATTTAAASKPAGPDWRTYGPLQVDWANWQPMGGSYVAPSLNAEGQPLYTAINCGARKLNSTSQTGQWRTWEAPRSDSEEQLVSDLCKAKGS